MTERHWSIHVEFVVMFITLISGFYLLDNKVERLTQRQSERTDKLYEMFVDILKESKSKS